MEYNWTREQYLLSTVIKILEEFLWRTYYLISVMKKHKKFTKVALSELHSLKQDVSLQ